jgi:murein DD-endopeptidase MepM/ murein hydrolase activator NlpD
MSKVLSTPVLALLAIAALTRAAPQARTQASQTTAPAIAIELDARAFQPGEVVLITIKTPVPADRVQVRAWNRGLLPWRVDALTWRALGGLDLDIAPGRYEIAIEAGGSRATREVVVTPKTFRTRTLTVDEAFVNPPANVQPRIAQEAKRLASLWQEPAATRLWAAPFAAPVPQPANSAFGSRSVYNGQPRNAHSGADFASPAGTPVACPGAGRVVLAANLYYSGNTVIVDHGLGLFSMMAHLSKISVQEKASVARGDILGLVGATGRVTGPHLHWTVRLGEARVDPISLLELIKRE